VLSLASVVSCDAFQKPDDTGHPDTSLPPHGDTGLAWVYFTGDFGADRGEYTSARFGMAVAARPYGSRPIGNDWLCAVRGTLPLEGTAPAGCPNCDWSFDLGPATDSTADGDYCDQIPWGQDGAMDGYFDYAWGFASRYYYDGGSGYYARFDDNVMLYIGSTWVWFAGNYSYAGSTPMSDGDGTSVHIERPVFGDSAQYSYEFSW
jgi:hypothetical protein